MRRWHTFSRFLLYKKHKTIFKQNKELLGIVNAALSVLESTDCVNEAILCIQQLQMFVPEYDSLPRILPKICNYLRTESPALQTVAIGCLRQLSQRNRQELELTVNTRQSRTSRRSRDQISSI